MPYFASSLDAEPVSDSPGNRFHLDPLEESPTPAPFFWPPVPPMVTRAELLDCPAFPLDKAPVGRTDLKTSRTSGPWVSQLVSYPHFIRKRGQAIEKKDSPE